MSKKILIVDDKRNTLKVVGAILKDEGYVVFEARSSVQALEILENQKYIDAVLSDLKMPGKDGLELYRKVRAIEPDIPFLIMTAYGTIESAVKAMKEGVSNYLIKPLNYEELGLVLERAIREKEIFRELDSLREQIRERYSIQNIVGTSQKMREIYELVHTVAPTDAPILIHGETGTGKELVARAVHSLSRRRNRRMVCINSAALAESILEAELFGYKKGAFTGAIMNKKGRLESADGGTLFLDEIGQMSLNLQGKLLRFLQDGTFDPVGGTESHRVNVRVIAATNRDLQKEMKSRRFLSDLFYRIEVISITLPPLRERRDDIPLLVNHFIKRYAEQYTKEIDAIQPRAIEVLVKDHWPGNVRELENCVARAVILCKGRQIQLEDLPERLQSKTRKSLLEPGNSLLGDIPEDGITLKEMERELIQKTLKKCSGNKTLTAGNLGISRKALYEKMERYGISL